MTINSSLDPEVPELGCDHDKSPKDWMKTGFYVIAVLFNLCLIAQLLTVGIAYFNDPGWWNIHVLLVRGYAGISLVLLAGARILPFSKRIRALATSLPVLLGLQFGSIHIKTPLHLEILHPLIGFSLVYVSSTLVHRVWRTISPSTLESD